MMRRKTDDAFPHALPVGFLHFEQFLEFLGSPASVAVEDGEEGEDQAADNAGDDDGNHVLGGDGR